MLFFIQKIIFVLLITNKKRITANTHTIHWFAGSWLTGKAKCKKIIKSCLNFVTFGLVGIIAHKSKRNKK